MKTINIFQTELFKESNYQFNTQPIFKFNGHNTRTFNIKEIIFSKDFNKIIDNIHDYVHKDSIILVPEDSTNYTEYIQIAADLVDYTNMEIVQQIFSNDTKPPMSNIIYKYYIKIWDYRKKIPLTLRNYLKYRCDTTALDSTAFDSTTFDFTNTDFTNSDFTSCNANNKKQFNYKIQLKRKYYKMNTNFISVSTFSDNLNIITYSTDINVGSTVFDETLTFVQKESHRLDTPILNLDLDSLQLDSTAINEYNYTNKYIPEAEISYKYNYVKLNVTIYTKYTNYAELLTNINDNFVTETGDKFYTYNIINTIKQKYSLYSIDKSYNSYTNGTNIYINNPYGIGQNVYDSTNLVEVEINSIDDYNKIKDSALMVKIVPNIEKMKFTLDPNKANYIHIQFDDNFGILLNAGSRIKFDKINYKYICYII